MIKKGDRVFVKKEYQDPGDDCFQWIACEDEDGGRVLVSTVALGSIHPTGVFHTYMLETRKYATKLNHTPNPDITGGYWQQPTDPKQTTIHTDTLRQARDEFVAWRERNRLGAGNLSADSGEVTKGDKIIGRFSYNARFWKVA